MTSTDSDFPPSRLLSDGNKIPVIGYGLGTANYKRKEAPADQKIIDATVSAIKAGYFHLDGAEAYQNEEELGIAIKQSGVPREKLYVTTKTSCKAGETIEQAFSRSLGKLGLDYVDLYLIHSPFWANSPQDLQRAWAEMEAIKKSGRARSIGVSNYLQEHLEATLETAQIPPAVNQIEFHPYLQHGDLLRYHREKGIAVEAYGPLTAIVRAAPGPVDAAYKDIAETYEVSEADVALRWCLDQGLIVLTTSSSEQRLKGYLSALSSFQLMWEEIDWIKEEGRKKHYRVFWTHKLGPEDKR